MFLYNIVGYARVSSREQAENCHALEQQIDRLESAGAEYVFVDVESGANPERPDYKKLIELVENGAIKMVIATRWDRLTRNELVYLQLKNLFQYSAVKLKLLDQGDVDLNSAFAEGATMKLKRLCCKGFKMLIWIKMRYFQFVY